MNLRKEQTLCLVTLALAAWLYTSMDDAGSVRRRTPKSRDLAAAAAREPILVEADAAPKNLREVFVEPSESRPLEPRQDLELPKMQRLPVVVLPLPIGQHPGALHGLRRRIDPAESAARQGNGGNPQVPAGPAPSDGGGGGGDDPSLRYDALIRLSQPTQVYWGLVLGDEKRKFELHLNKAMLRAGTTFRFQWIEPKTGKRLDSEWVVKGDDVKEIRLAKTLRNEIGLKAHKLEPAPHNVTEQRDFILYLIEQARKEAWVFDLAMERARAYRKFARPKEEGWLYVAKVLRAKGDLPGAYKMFKDIEEELQGSSFQLRGLGVVEAALGLDKLAEKHLRRAVAINDPIDPRNYAALATFLLDRGRAEEAVEFADQAVSFKGRREPTLGEKVAFHGLKVRAHLAVGDLDGAYNARFTDSVGGDPRLAELARYQSASVAYARGEIDAALDEFQQCAQSGHVPDAQLGIAACKFLKGDFAGALADFGKVADDNPKLRHLALCGSGLVLSHTEGEGANALERIDAALVCDPLHAYGLYLQGRQRRLNGDLQGAVAALKRALRRQDDFVEALAELTETYYRIYGQDDDPAALVSAIRYVDRLVELDQKQGAKDPLFLELQGKIHFEARDVRGARRAFTAGAEAGSKVCMVGLGLLDYVQKRTDRCEERFSRMLRDEPPGAPIRVHVEKLLELMQEHANKEQVVDNFAYTQKTKNWAIGQNGARPRFEDGVVRIQGKLRQANRPIYLRRTLQGFGRFVELGVDMKLDGPHGNTTFAGVQIGIPGRGANPSRFQVRFGVDERGQLLLERIDGRKAVEPQRFDVVVSTGQWHSLRLVTFADPTNPKSNVLWLRAIYDGQVVAEHRLQSMRRSATQRTDFNTDLRVEGRVGLPVDVSFRRYRRVQIKG